MEGATVIRPTGNPFWYHHLAPMGGAYVYQKQGSTHVAVNCLRYSEN
jgi:hypothetical protein